MVDIEYNKIYTINNLSKIIKTPFYFPSISSVKANFDIIEYLRIIKSLAYPGFLISAYDIYHYKNKKLLFKELNSNQISNSFILLDSGNYEAFWKNDKNWTFNKYESVLKEFKLDLAFSFDASLKEKQSLKKYIDEINFVTVKGAGAQFSGITVPIIHILGKDSKKILTGVIEGINPSIIALPERELGATLLQRAKAIKQIRKHINSLNRDLPIHLLGTGNPLSMLTYIYTGANLFDALEWNIIAINPKNANVYHFSHLELFDCNCDACKTKKIPYHLKVCAHNLLFYDKFITDIREHIGKKTIKTVLKKYLPKKFIEELEK